MHEGEFDLCHLNAGSLKCPAAALVQDWPSAALGASDQIWCMYSFVLLEYGLLLPLLLLFLKEMHFRGAFCQEGVG